MEYPKQGDPRWANHRIGKTRLTLEGYGCTISSISCLTSWYKPYFTPPETEQQLKFNKSGEILWLSMNEKSCKLPMTFVRRYYSFQPDIIEAALRSKDQSCILRFPAFGASHWCTVLGVYNNGTYKIHDPLDGKVKNSSRYGRPDGFTIFTRKA